MLRVSPCFAWKCAVRRSLPDLRKCLRVEGSSATPISELRHIQLPLFSLTCLVLVVAIHLGDMAWSRRKSRCFYPRNQVHRPISCGGSEVSVARVGGSSGCARRLSWGTTCRGRKPPAYRSASRFHPSFASRLHLSRLLSFDLHTVLHDSLCTAPHVSHPPASCAGRVYSS